MTKRMSVRALDDCLPILGCEITKFAQCEVAKEREYITT